MVASRGFLAASLVAGAVALQAREMPDDAFRTVSSRLNEFHAGLAKAREESLEAMTQQKAGFETELRQLQSRNKDAEANNVRLAEAVEGVRRNNIELRENARELTEECQSITAELQTMQSNISTAQEFISRSVNATGLRLYGAPELRVLTELESADEISERRKHYEKRLSDLERLADNQVSMIQLGATEMKPVTEGFLQDLLSSWNSISSQQNTSLLTLTGAFDKERSKLEQKHEALLQEFAELNATKLHEEALNIKLQGAVAHLKVSREHLRSDHMAMKTFAKRLGDLPLHGEGTPPPSTVGSDKEDRPGPTVASLLSWLPR